MLTPLRGWGWGKGGPQRAGSADFGIETGGLDGHNAAAAGWSFLGWLSKGQRRLLGGLWRERGFHHEHFVALRVWEDVESARWVGGEAGAVSGV